MKGSGYYKLRYMLWMTLCACILGSCSQLLGWGVLLWSAEDPPIPSGTVLPVYIRSNIDQVWVAGVPSEYIQPGVMDKFEIPLAQFEFSGSKNAAKTRAAAFAPLALTYAETLQDGLPIREEPDNGARRVYRLKMGQIIKVLNQAQGNPAISATGDPLPGDWYRVLTEDGSAGYCFSYRLRLFEHTRGPLMAGAPAPEKQEDPDLDMALAKIWSPESYGAMIAANRIDLEALGKRWRFSPGQDAGLARIHTAELDRTFSYTGIQPDGPRSWRFEGASLGMTLQNDTTLAVHYQDDGGLRRTLIFTALPSKVEDLIAQETERRNALFANIYRQGPAFVSANYGTLIFFEDGRFTWSGSGLLIPRIIPSAALGSGAVDMDLFLAPPLAGRYEGALSLRFDRIGGGSVTVRFMYTLDERGLRIEYAPPEHIEGVTVLRRDASPTVIFFYRNREPGFEGAGEF